MWKEQKMKNILQLIDIKFVRGTEGKDLIEKIYFMQFIYFLFDPFIKLIILFVNKKELILKDIMSF